jgi:Flp pilus assembly pilin Flp
MVFHRIERGQGMVEYALIIVLIAIVVVFTLSLFGTELYNTYSKIAYNLAWLN